MSGSRSKCGGIKNDHVEGAVGITEFPEQLKDIAFEGGVTISGKIVERYIFFKQRQRIGR